MSLMIVSIVQAVLTSLLVAMVTALGAALMRFRKEQRESNRLMRESIASMQKAELMRMFQRVVEDGKPVTVEELEHLDSCYQSYHANGGNGTGTLLYERVRENAFVVTKAGKGESR